MTTGARINKPSGFVKYLVPIFRKSYYKKCPVCGKSLGKRNKIGICSDDYNTELKRNMWFQINKFKPKRLK